MTEIEAIIVALLMFGVWTAGLLIGAYIDRVARRLGE